MNWVKLIKGKKTKDLIKEYFSIILGSLMVVGLVVFISPLKLAPGGVYGIAIILHHIFDFPIGLSGIALDILFIVRIWILGPKFELKQLWE